MNKIIINSIAIVLSSLFLFGLAVSCGPEEEQPVAVTGVSLSQKSLTLEQGGTASLIATVSPSNAADKTVTWSTSNPSVATVDNGTVTAVGEGTVTIMVTAGGKTASCDVTVTKKAVSPESFELSQTEVRLFIGESLTLEAIFHPENTSNKNVVWRVSSSRLIQIDQNGVITALNVGEATVFAVSSANESLVASCKVTVVDPKMEEARSVLMKIYDAMDGPNWTRKAGWGTDQPLPTWEGVTYSTGRFELLFRGFGLKGEIPECVGELTGLTSFRIDNEPLVTGTLPDSFGQLVNLKQIYIVGTSMTSLPDIFSGMIYLEDVVVNQNEMMTGPIPESIGSSDKLRQLSLGFNFFTGNVPDSWVRHRDHLYVQHNCLTGKIPDFFLQGDRDKVARSVTLLMRQREGYGFDISDTEIPGYWPTVDIDDIVTGQSFNFADVVKENKYTVYISWAPWCPYSKSLMPQLLDYYDKYQEDGLEIIATQMVPEDLGDMQEEDERKQLATVIEKGYDRWYNFYFSTTPVPDVWPSGTPKAEVYDSQGNVVFSSFYSFFGIDSRERYNHAAVSELIPFLETVLGPAETPDEYSSTDYSMDGEVMTLQTAAVGAGINLVFMGDAYTDRDMGKDGLYETVMRQAMEEFFSIEPYKTFRDRFNVYAVKVVSKNGRCGRGYSTAFMVEVSGKSISSGMVDKYYEYALKVPGIKDGKNLTIGVLANSRFDRGITKMNESLQSGAGVCGSASNDPELFGVTIRHEVGGHAFAFLDDEYAYYKSSPSREHIDYRTSMYEKYGWYSNIDFTNDPKKVKWSAFLSDDRYKDEVGIFEGGSLYTIGAYRPSENSMMRDNFDYYNAPSRWAIYKRIMELSGEEASFEKFLDYDAVNRKNQ
ncbi:MAG: Ig-like domain-containing protein [Bacteroidales bacterium]|nr:Ig-like domain-containing protein [Bacteroidales bacterium]